MDDTAARLIKRVNTLKATGRCMKASGGSATTYPLRGAGFSSEVLDAQSAKHKVAKLLDGTATDSSRMLASALMSGMTPANAQWLNLDSESLPDDAKAWLSTCATLVWGKHPRGQLRRRGLRGQSRCGVRRLVCAVRR